MKKQRKKAEMKKIENKSKERMKKYGRRNIMKNKKCKERRKKNGRNIDDERISIKKEWKRMGEEIEKKKKE